MGNLWATDEELVGAEWSEKLRGEEPAWKIVLLSLVQASLAELLQSLAKFSSWFVLCKKAGQGAPSMLRRSALLLDSLGVGVSGHITSQESYEGLLSNEWVVWVQGKQSLVLLICIPFPHCNDKSRRKISKVSLWTMTAKLQGFKVNNVFACGCFCVWSIQTMFRSFCHTVPDKPDSDTLYTFIYVRLDWGSLRNIIPTCSCGFDLSRTSSWWLPCARAHL